jgi:cytochrome c-type biogenesis protein
VNGELSIAVAIGAGLLSFLSPCVLPLVPAYVGQLTAVAVVGGSAGGVAGEAGPSRWLAVRHGLAYVAGFGLVFTLLGVTATYAAGALADYLPALRQLGGVILIVLGLNLAGVLRIPALDRTWRPLESGAAGSLAATTGTIVLASAPIDAGGGPGKPSFADRLGGRIVGTRGGWIASFGLGAIFAIGWTPCIGIILGGILTLAATSGSALQGGLLLVAYTAGLGIPFLAIAALYDRAPRLLAPLVRRGRLVSAIGGALVVAIGVAMLFDWLALLPRYFQFNSAI